MHLADLTTLRVGGPCDDVVFADTEESLVGALGAADADGVPVLLLSGGSNVVIGDEGWPGRTVLVRSRGVRIDGDMVQVAAGEPWDDFARAMVAAGRSGVESLVGIPGAVGSTPVQNVGAYGQEVADAITAVHVWDRQQHRQWEFGAADCEFGYRTSIFKSKPGRYVVLSVTFRLPATTLSAPLRYAELAERIGMPLGSSAPVQVVAAAVLALRAGKGMVLDAADHDTWSAGSFFTNPVLPSSAALPAGAPSFEVADGVKTSAAWLIQQAGFGKGYRLAPEAPAALSGKHSLALTNRGGATAEDVLALARAVREGVAEQFGITLVPEPVLVGCTL